MPSARRNDDLQLFGGAVAKSRWRFAKTYVESYPHEYTLQCWGDADNFWRAILRIGAPRAMIASELTLNEVARPAP